MTLKSKGLIDKMVSDEIGLRFFLPGIDVENAKSAKHATFIEISTVALYVFDFISLT